MFLFYVQILQFFNLTSLDLSRGRAVWHGRYINRGTPAHLSKILEGLPKLKKLDLSNNAVKGRLHESLAVLKRECKGLNLETLVFKK